jgi:hypothetical protein
MEDPENSSPAKTGAALPAPRKRTAGKGAPPPQVDTLGALPETDAALEKKRKDKDVKAAPAKAVRKDRIEPLNFRVTADFRRAFKRAAAAQDCKKVELLERIFAEWSDRNPS